VAVGDNGAVLTSPDGTKWTRQSSGAADSLQGVAHGKDLFLAVGDKGTVRKSTDGTTWSAESPGIPDSLRHVAFAGGRFSPPGTTGRYGRRRTGRSGGKGFRALPIASREPRTARPALSRPAGGAPSSCRGRREMDSGRTGVFRLAERSGVCGGRYVAVGDNGAIVTSKDGTAWFRNSSAPRPHCTPSPTGKGPSSSSAGTAPFWLPPISRRSRGGVGSPPHAARVVSGGGRLVAVGEKGVLLTSTDGGVWAPAASGTGRRLNGVAHGDNGFVAVATAGRSGLLFGIGMGGAESGDERESPRRGPAAAEGMSWSAPAGRS